MREESPAAFGELLRRRRERAGLTQEALAEKANLTANAIGALERGERRRPYPHTVRALADALDLAAAEREALVAAASQRTEAQTAVESVSTDAGQGLPYQLTGLVGRTAEVAVVQQLLRRSDLRLLTLTGPGGVGKTRLALAVAASCGDAFADGVAFVSLAPISEPALVLPAIAQGLGLQESSTPLLQGLQRWLRNKQFLMVIDSFEHVASAAPQLVALLEATPRLKVLITSREALRVRGEQEYLVPPLAFPKLERLPSAETVLEYDSVRLFVQRTQAVRPDFVLTEEEAPVVAAICARLDGLPLAIELAAARMALLTPQMLLARLEHQLQVLTRGSRDLPDRQQTLRAAIAWSYDLLTPAEQRLFRQLAIFAGGATLEAIVAVCGTEGDLSEEVIDQTESLVNKNLVRRAADDGETRIELLETIRAYGLEQLQASTEMETLQAKHASYFLALAESASPHLMGPVQTAWFRRLSQERNNLRAAVRFWLERDGHEEAVRLVWALWRFWWVSGMHREAHEWIRQIVERNASKTLPALRRSQAELVLGSMAWAAGDNSEAVKRCQAAVALCAEHQDRRTEAIALLMLGTSQLSQGSYDQAVTEILERSGRLFHLIGEEWGAAFATSYPGLVLLAQGAIAEALQRQEAALALAKQSHDRIVIHQVLYNLGITSVAAGDDQRALRNFAEGLAHTTEVEDSANAGYFIRGIAEVALRHSVTAEAVCLLGAAHALLEAVGAPLLRYSLEQCWHDQTIVHARTVLGDESFEQAWVGGETLSLEQAKAKAQTLAQLLRA